MENLLFTLNAVLPLVILVTIGYVLKRVNFFSKEFLAGANKLCFYVALPCLLFKNLYDSSLEDLPWRLIIFVVIGIVSIFILSLLYAIFFVKDNNQKGVMIQGMMRSNYAFIGIPLATSLFSDALLIEKTGTCVALVSIFCIPLFNILSVIALSLFVESDDNSKPLKKALIGILKNPLIKAILLGVLVLLFRLIVPSSSNFVENKISFLYKVLDYLAKISTPLALLVVGGQFEFKLETESRKQVIIGVATKMVIYPVVVFLIACLIGFKNYEFAVLVSVFASPIAVASAIMAREMKNDYKLASQLVVWSTLLSSVTIFIIVFLLKSLGYL